MKTVTQDTQITSKKYTTAAHKKLNIKVITASSLTIAENMSFPLENDSRTWSPENNHKVLI